MNIMFHTFVARLYVQIDLYQRFLRFLKFEPVSLFVELHSLNSSNKEKNSKKSFFDNILIFY